MAGWWYAVGNQKLGPVESVELKKHLVTDAISLDTLVWCEGRDHWTPLRDVEELAGLSAALPPPLPVSAHLPARGNVFADSAEVPAPARAWHAETKRTGAVGMSKVDTAVSESAETPLATRWPRFFARLFDIWLINPVVMIAGLVALLVIDSNNRLANSPMLTGLALLLLPAVMIIDALVYGIFGNTLGKALLGIKVRGDGGQRLSIVQYLGRNIGVWMVGLGLGLPLVSFFSLLYQGSHMRRAGIASYEEGTPYRARQYRAGVARKIVFALLWLVLLVMNSVLVPVMREIWRARSAPNTQTPANITAPPAASAAAVPLHEDASGRVYSTADQRRCGPLYVGGEMPIIKNSKLAQQTAYLCYDGFAVLYNGITRTPLWSATHITDRISSDRFNATPPTALRVDDRLPLADRTTSQDFIAEGFDTVLLTWPQDLGSEVGKVQSATYANAALMSSGRATDAWRKLHDGAQKVVSTNHELYVVTGVLFEGSDLRIVNGRMLVPTAFYFAVYIPGTPSTATAYIVENTAEARLDVITLDELERRAQINLFPGLPAAVKQKM